MRNKSYSLGDNFTLFLADFHNAANQVHGEVSDPEDRPFTLPRHRDRLDACLSADRRRHINVGSWGYGARRSARRCTKSARQTPARHGPGMRIGAGCNHDSAIHNNLAGEPAAEPLEFLHQLRGGAALSIWHVHFSSEGVCAQTGDNVRAVRPKLAIGYRALKLSSAVR